jgi:hypothetical protein
LAIVIFVETKPFENRRGVLQDQRHYNPAFLGVGHAATPDGLHAIERNLHFARLSAKRIERL